MRVERAALAAVAAAALAPACSRAPNPDDDARPNVALIILDDVGLDALRMYAADGVHRPDLAENVPHAYPETPALDALAAAGVRFTQARSNPTCSASRATLLTGRYAFRHGIGGLVRAAEGARLGRATTVELGVGRGNEETTLGHLARAAGYEALFCGKYHLALTEDRRALGGEPGYGWEHVREVAGFDDFWVVWDNLPVRAPPEPAAGADGREYPPGYFNFFASAGGELEHRVGEYATSVQVDEALELVRGAEQPWLLVLSFSAGHAPFDLPPAGLIATEHYARRAEAVLAARREQDAEIAVPSVWPFYFAILEALDRELGRFVRELKRDGSYERTIFVVIGDNGTPNRVVESAVEREQLPVGKATTQLVRDERQRFKHSVFECGVRVPLLVSGPIVAAPGRTSNALVDATDIFATVADAMSIDPAAVVPADRITDGVSLAPILANSAAHTSRIFSYIERFQPNGDPALIEYEPGQMSNNYQWRRGFVLETETGRYKLVRNLDEDDEPADVLFRLTDTSGAPFDPWELAPLDLTDDENARRLTEARAAMAQLLASEPGG